MFVAVYTMSAFSSLVNNLHYTKTHVMNIVIHFSTPFKVELTCNTIIIYYALSTLHISPHIHPARDSNLYFKEFHIS